MRYRDWLNLNLHLLWCHNLPVARGRPDAGQPVMRSSEYTNSGAWFVREGWAAVAHDGQCYRAEPGQWLIVRPCKRVQSFSADARMISIAFDARWPDGSHLFDEGLSIVLDADKVPSLEPRVRPILDLMKQVNPDSWEARDHRVDLATFLRLENLLCDWLAALGEVLAARGVMYSGHSAIDERVLAAIDLLQASDLAEPFDSHWLSSALGVSQNHLIRLFRQELQTTPAKYRDQLRAEYARNRLLQPESRIKEVALELGFNQLSHFSTWFKKHTGKTPREIRKG